MSETAPRARTRIRLRARGRRSARRTRGEGAFEIAPPTRPAGLFRRALTTNRQLLALAAGGLAARARAPGAGRLTRLGAATLGRLVRAEMRELPFPAQLRRRLEMLGPTYIKLGQILSLREDILPRAITDELKHLLDRLPVVPYAQWRALVRAELARPLGSMFAWIDPEPLGSASIAQIHRATTREGDAVVLKVVKPGIRETLRRDAVLLRLLGRVLQVVFPRYQPRRIIAEFVDYTLREVDLRLEADNAEAFAANFADVPDVVFPRIFRHYSSRGVLCMEYFDGLRPDSRRAKRLPEAERVRLVDLGAQSIIRMLYQDGLFHADLHPGNLLILPETRVGFIDLGMVGRLDPELRRTLLYYYYALVSGDAESAGRYLTAVAVPGPGADPNGFRREIAGISGRWRRAASFEGFSLARLILESVQRGAQFRMYFPVELVLMVKALVTFEGVGHMLLPDFDVAQVSRPHIRHIFLAQFSPVRFARDGLRGAPDLVDALVKLPLLVTEGLRVIERGATRHTESPFAGLRGTLLAGACLVAGAILLALGGPWPAWAALFAGAVFFAVRG